MKKKIIIAVGTILSVFILLSAGWFLWREVRFNQYTEGMERNGGLARASQPFYRRAFFPIYWYGVNCCKDVIYTVRFPDRLFSSRGSLTIQMPRHEIGWIYITPLRNGEYKIRTFGVYIDSQGNAIDSAFDEVIEQHRATIDYLLNRAHERWSTLN